MRVLGHAGYRLFDPRRCRNALAFRVARPLRRRTVSVLGQWGPVTGLADDDVMLRHYGRFGTWAATTVEAIAATARSEPMRRWRLVDVGSNIGLVTLGVLRKVPLAVDLVEPDPASFALLRHNMTRLVPGADIRFHAVAVGNPVDGETRVVPVRSPRNGGDIRMRPAAASEPGVPLLRLDDVVAVDEGETVILKVDVQGAEGGVLAGATRLLARTRLMVIEFAPEDLRAAGDDPMALAETWLCGASRAALVIDEHWPQIIHWTEPQDLKPALARLVDCREPGLQVELLLDRDLAA